MDDNRTAIIDNQSGALLGWVIYSPGIFRDRSYSAIGLHGYHVGDTATFEQAKRLLLPRPSEAAV